MDPLIGILYVIIILTLILVGSFIVFHLASYSVNKSLAHFTIFIFVIGAGILIISNIILFLAIPKKELQNFTPNFQNTNTLPFGNTNSGF